jgi:hypothetical protein
MKRVIIESPYKGNVERNTEYARACMHDSVMRGEAPIASHLLYTQPGILDDKVPEERAMGIAAGLAWRGVCELQVFCVDLGLSDGMAEALVQCADEGRPYELRTLGYPWSEEGQAESAKAQVQTFLDSRLRPAQVAALAELHEQVEFDPWVPTHSEVADMSGGGDVVITEITKDLNECGRWAAEINVEPRGSAVDCIFHCGMFETADDAKKWATSTAQRLLAFCRDVELESAVDVKITEAWQRMKVACDRCRRSGPPVCGVTRSPAYGFHDSYAVCLAAIEDIRIVCLVK